MLNQNLYLEKIAEIDTLIQGKKFSSALAVCKLLIEDQYIVERDKVYLLLSHIYFNLKKYEESCQYFLKINDVNLKDNKYFFFKGKIFEKIGDFEKAEHGYYVALRKSPKNRRYLKKYIEYSCKFNYYGSAIKKIEKLVRSKPEKSFYLNLEIAKFYIQKNDLKKAFFILKNISSSNEIEQSLIQETYSLIYESFGDYETALRKLDVINSLDIYQALKKDELIFKNESKRSNNIFDFYNFNYLEKNNILTIIFSSIENKFILKGYDFNTSSLFVSEKLMTYYTYQYENLINYIVNIVKENNFEKINLVGSSKGSFAAINVAVGLEKQLEQKKIRVIAFSPQSYIYPLNNNIKGLPSYKKALD
ncbi:hypothetical protein [Acinetobacter thermotolerans]|uniref:tetratricopeptide repeat protein n=1 Tax=Acinetobacter thermotolerans TaxID=3151487 RepID=UPI00325A909E